MSKREIARSWASRTLLTARAGLSAARVAGRAAIDRASEWKDGDLIDAEALVDRLDELKGLSMKIGQMASIANGELPPRVTAVLAKLQSQATGLAPEVVLEVVEKAYGRPASEVFDNFDPVPFAAASIGQVHRARVQGRPVAVKIQYPGVEEAIATDVKNLASLRFLLAASSFGTRELVEELRERLREECDYRQEAEYQLRFRRAFAGAEGAVVPDVLVELCRKEILVSEYLEGERFAAFRDRAAPEEKGRAGLELWKFAFRAIFVEGMFNGDPHPGNYLFLPGGRVGFLDYGCVRVFDPGFVDRWKRFARAILNDDRPSFPRAAEELGIVGSRRFDHDAAWASFRLIYSPMLTPRFRFDKAFAKAAFDTLTWSNPNLLRTNIPPNLAFSWRLNWGLFSVLADLEAEADFATPFREAVGE